MSVTQEARASPGIQAQSATVLTSTYIQFSWPRHPPGRSRGSTSCRICQVVGKAPDSFR
jgi:hypothetical protein